MMEKTERSPSGGNFPVESTPWVGREAELSILSNLADTVAGDGGRILLITGAAGVGKSRLMREARQRFFSNYLDRKSVV